MELPHKIQRSTNQQRLIVGNVAKLNIHFGLISDEQHPAWIIDRVQLFQNFAHFSPRFAQHNRFSVRYLLQHFHVTPGPDETHPWTKRQHRVHCSRNEQGVVAQVQLCTEQFDIVHIVVKVHYYRFYWLPIVDDCRDCSYRFRYRLIRLHPTKNAAWLHIYSKGRTIASMNHILQVSVDPKNNC
uniref:Uncharacterized protein n=1 Tax=Anopheles culicifacies TaxID=139723 RepID=A0A182LX67_9DIPT